jgi:hypothetical protein
MATLATITDIKEYEPDIENYGINDFTAEITKAQNDVFRDLRIRWWPTQQLGLYDVKFLTTGQIDPDDDLYTASQLTRVCCYQALGFHIYPKLAKFEPDMDIFERKMDFYRKEYDLDSSGTVDDAEREPTHYLRLKR